MHSFRLPERIELYNLEKPIPRGVLSGAPTVKSAARLRVLPLKFRDRLHETLLD